MYDTPDITINKQHKKLVELMDEMVNLETTADTEYQLIPKFGKFLMYLENHFEYENSAMCRANYFDYADHTAVHTHMLGLLNIMYRKALYDSSTLKQALPIIVAALTNHIELETSIFKTELLPNFQSVYAELS